MIGLSVSLCVRDIVEGRVNREDVHIILAGTNTNHGEPDSLDKVIASYRENYWYANPDACEQLCRDLYSEEIIVEPRSLWADLLREQPANEVIWERYHRGQDVTVNIAAGHWMTSDEQPEIVCKDCGAILQDAQGKRHTMEWDQCEGCFRREM